MASISAGNDLFVGEMIADALDKVGSNGVLSIESSNRCVCSCSVCSACLYALRAVTGVCARALCALCVLMHCTLSATRISHVTNSSRLPPLVSSTETVVEMQEGVMRNSNMGAHHHPFIPHTRITHHKLVCFPLFTARTPWWRCRRVWTSTAATSAPNL